MAGLRCNWGSNLRFKCFVIGYLSLIVGLVDITLHFFVVAVVSRGFECDVDTRLLNYFNVPSLGPVLFFLNLGTHGFYPFPIIYPFFFNTQMESIPIPIQPKCYPGMIHLYQIDILNFLINAIWFKFVISFVRAVHRKDAESMKMFYGLSMVKVILQVIYFAYQPYTHYLIPLHMYWFLALTDIAIAMWFVHITNKYIKQLLSEKSQQIVDQPPSYIECLINATQSKKEEKSEGAVPPAEPKTEMLTDVAVGARP